MRKNEQLRHIVWMLLGSMLLAFSYYHINFQNHLAEGGFVGLALIGKYTFDWSPALTVLMLDIPVFVAAWFFQGRRFIMNTALATGVFSLTYELCERYSPWVMNFGSNMVLAAVVSGVLTGFAAGIVLRHGGATGGDDIVALLISRLTMISVGTVFMLIDIAVLLVSLFYLPLWDTLYTILAVSIAGKVITWTVQAGVLRRAVPVRSQAAVHHQHGSYTT
ncbi:YitT family protein [Paenibacillus melissococcoides]|uniref:YitT family protein n=1 Tax=Paenibacillus melissococcoides TaxID=2912268 RepID=A0ABN8U2B9_9BACL|nr:MULTISPECIES: YitT family protein [Paenibacillus]MEB9896090.1 YitT family protein [Bacillus cereus]CAH8243684.1 YitT family protein [Paenibacillus melissococcoides]CAH8704901.1 YitT family protein [Paenibacillus melissococcoides]CAH8707674.1 YitT family protein [Paenibacillus melissococcoides]GIO77487.1 membrane protein [Paenibacillus dendritiformis]